MSTSNVIFTAVPSGDQAPPMHTVKLNVLVSPRLLSNLGAPVLQVWNNDFNRWAWPARLHELRNSIKVQFGNGTPVAATLVSWPTGSSSADVAERTLRERMWRDIFPNDRRVVPHTFNDMGARSMVPYPAALVGGHVGAIYAHAANTVTGPAQFPVGVTPGDPVNASFVDEVIRDFAGARDVLHKAPFPVDPNVIGRSYSRLSRSGAAYLALRFYDRHPRGVENLPLPPFREDFEFHEIIALMGDHPTLMRKLGLVFEVSVPATSIPASTGTVKVLVPWRDLQNVHANDIAPFTQYVLNGQSFLPAPKPDSPLTNGFLRMDAATGRARAVPFEIDGSVFKLAEMAVAARQQLTNPDEEPITHTTLPAIRSNGFSIVQYARHQYLDDQFRRQLAANAARNQAVLYADDLVRGFRIDVSELDGPWRSVHRRDGSIDIGAGGAIGRISVADEEGYVKAGTATRGSYDASELYLHEVIAGWNGYSLSARPPGKAIAHSDDPDGPPEVLVDVRNNPGQKVLVQAEYTATKRTLPRLRFGRPYRLRVRAADVTGGGLTLANADAAFASPSQVYRRFEPIPTPVLVHRRAITEAESLEHMVIRSEPGKTPTTYVGGLPAQFGSDFGYTATNERHVLPPKAALALVETHGFLDAALADRNASRSVFHLARRERGNIGDKHVINIDTGAKTLVPNLVVKNKPSAHPARQANLPDRGTPLEEGQYICHTGEEATLTWLPDPMADAVVVFDDYPASMSAGPNVLRVPIPRAAGSHRWARAQSMKIVVAASPDHRLHKVWSATANPRVIQILVPQGCRFQLGIASAPVEARLDHLGIWGMMSPEKQVERRSLVVNGLHGMISPPRLLTVVHAVQKPLGSPAFVGLSSGRDENSTGARLSGSITCHGESTAHLDIRARWYEISDSPDEPEPRCIMRSANVDRLPVEYHQDSVPLQKTTRKKTRVRDNLAGHWRLKVTEAPAVTVPVVQDFGDTRARKVAYAAVASTRYQEYFAPKIIKDRENLEIRGESTSIDVPCSAAPAVPGIAQIVPTFRWRGNATNRIRKGGSLRVYLERGWFDSGEGEKLAVVLKRSGGQVTDAERRFVSVWGRDPVWNRATSEPLSERQFSIDTSDKVSPFGPPTNPQQRVRGVGPFNLADGGPTVTLMTYHVEWSAERKLWFADIDIDVANQYAPMVSLALARYQEMGQRLSAIVRADFIQLAADRTASVTHSASSVSVALNGVRAGTATNASNGTKASLRLQQRNVAHGDLGWMDLGAAVQMTATNAGWTGTVNRPATPANHEQRLVISEVELHGPDFQFTPGERLTFMDVVPLA